MIKVVVCIEKERKHFNCDNLSLENNILTLYLSQSFLCGIQYLSLPLAQFKLDFINAWWVEKESD